MSQHGHKLENLTRALQRLKEAAVIAGGNHDSLIRDGLIQRFEFTYELTWKALKEYFEANGIVDKNSPKAVFKEAYTHRFITNEPTWLSMIDDRNLTSHVYSEEVAVEIAERIITSYVPEFEILVQKLTKES